ncbi:MAG: endolytic transglycosylase MltG [Alphaproteobacteria bacterium]
MTFLRSGTLWVVLIVLVFAGVLGTALWGYHMAQPGPLQAEKRVVIAAGSGVNAIAKTLAQEGVIESSTQFHAAVRLMGLGGTLRAGEYVFPAQFSLRSVVNMLALGDVAGRRVTIPEGLTVKQIVERLKATEGVVDDTPTLPAEGTLFPDTYAYQHGDKLSVLLKRMETRLQEELAKAWAARHPDVPFATPQDMLILASMIEKETGLIDERARVAGVFINRLRLNMKLQSDPTVIYGATDYAGNLTTVHLREPHPYNTYVHRGLPPTPIANIGTAALMAAAQPEAHNFIFFVADGHGGHAFAVTYPEHLANLEKYIKTYKEKHGQ